MDNRAGVDMGTLNGSSSTLTLRYKDELYIYVNDEYEAIEALIRTEKQKLLAEVRERVVGEDKYPAKESSDLMKQLSPNVRRCEWQNELRGEQRTLLDKLEAEL